MPTGVTSGSAVQPGKPTGWLVCDGSVVPNGSGTVQGVTADFSDLYTLLGTTYGTAGTLPDLQGSFIRGWTNKDTGAYDETINSGKPGPSWNLT